METGQPCGSIQRTEQRGCRTEREYQTRASSYLPFFPSVLLFFSHSSFFSTSVKQAKTFWGCFVSVKKRTQNMKVTLAPGDMPHHFSPTPQKQQGYPVNSLARADNVEMLTTANLRRVSDLRNTAGDKRERE